MYLKTIDETEATGKVADIYAAQKAQLGFVMSAAQCLTSRDDLLPSYTEFVNTMRGGFTLSPRDWRIITLIAAREVKSTYCSMVYGKQLIADLGGKEMVLAVQRDFRNAGLPPRDVAMLTYAEKVARDASQVTLADIDALRKAGFTDANISDIALCAAFRCFIGRFFDAVGAGPEAAFLDDDQAWRKTLTVGKPA
ncbi:peroxidase-related enzyme [Ferrovibrio terrae]|uniref:Peroxidase-related enzyme n=1 Tax=Ferrovibrio terrae TaxID=2594003 RepID=A0A516H606_9PROT|nr:peroxidase-related enzyme [Ferrovibrio terrae]QDO99196.1 peroxidase-related enzyme [Ferrovibrio terrae]